MTSRRRIAFQLYEQGSVGTMAKKLIQAAGGVVCVVTTGGAAKASITDKDGVALSNPLTLTGGGAEFYVLSTVDRVDLYGMAPGGQFFVAADVDESIADIGVDVTKLDQVAVIPFSADDSTAAAETDTGFDLPLHSAVKPNPKILVTAIDATETMDVGLLSSETAGDADGFINAIALDTLGLVKATLLASADTMGALLSVLDSANAGDDAPEEHVITASNARSVTYTQTAGSDTGAGFILLSYQLCAAA